MNQSIGEHIERHDPTLSLPYRIDVEEGRSPRIGSRGKSEQLDVFLGGDEESWTRALKFVLADIKWIIAWSTKHCYERPYASSLPPTGGAGGGVANK